MNYSNPTRNSLPWQKTMWESLLARKNQNRLPHALLFTGVDGIGKKEFALKFANYLLCHSPENNNACGHCRSCHLQQAASHPDFMCVVPEEDAQFIKIDQIREVVHFVNGTAMLNGYRVIVIDPASAMNMNAANALLKTLEEPTANTLFILIANQNLRLPATISSRCQKIFFTKPEREMALTWLQSEMNQSSPEALASALDLAEGAPLQARDFLKNDMIAMQRDLSDGLMQLSLKKIDPLQFAAKWEDKDIKIVLKLLLIWLRDLVRCQFRENNANSDCQKILDYYDMIQKIYAEILRSLNMNRSLLLKEIFIRWVKVC